jgi:hypothetical protein
MRTCGVRGFREAAIETLALFGVVASATRPLSLLLCVPSQQRRPSYSGSKRHHRFAISAPGYPCPVGELNSKQFPEFFFAYSSLFQNVFESRCRQIAAVECHDRRSTLPLVPENEVASLLSLFNESRPLQRSYDVHRSDSR